MIYETSLSLLDRLVRNNTDDCWREFIDTYRPLILSSIAKRSIPADAAEDICQETLAQILDSIATFRHNGRQGAFRNWVKRIVSQKVWRYFQAEQAQQQIRQDLHSCYPAGLQYDAELERIWDQDHDRHVIARLLEMVRREFSPGTWHAFRLNVLEGLSPKHAAEELSISVNAILIAKSRIMRRLRQLGEKMVEIPAIHQIGLDDPPESQEPRTLATRMERQ